MRVEILTVGDELLLGYTTDTNATFLSRELAALGVEVVRRTSTGDAVASIAAAMSEALSRSGAVIVTGGLGPTLDDVTRDAAAIVFGVPLEEDAAIVRELEQRFASRGYSDKLPQTNRRQAMVPVGAEILRNRHGTAPGLWMQDAAGSWMALLPGVPRELRGLFADEVRHRIQQRAPAGAAIVSHTLRTTGIAESVLAERIEDSGFELPPLAYLPSVEGVDIRITLRGTDDRTIRRAIDAAAARLRPVLAEYMYGEGDADLAATVLRMCHDKGHRIAVAESCTGGLLGSRLTAVPGASDVFIGGVIAYANAVKTAALGVGESVLIQHGAVSEATVRAMAAGVCSKFGAGVGIAISGVAGPGGGTPTKPVGTVWVCVQVGGMTAARMRVLPGDREEIRRRAAQMALDVARRLLLDPTGTPG